MAIMLLLCCAVILSCIIANRFSNKFGMPALLCFMALGMIFGSDGLFKISFDNYIITEQLCTIALIFIMFYGGFGTKWQTARPVAVKAVLLSTLGVVITAVLTCLFCYQILHFSFSESFLIGAVLSSTDAASVFSILRSKNLNLKHSTAPLLEIESGSTTILAGDTLILSVPSYRSENDGKLKEILIEPEHNWCHCTIADLKLPENILIALIKRGDENIIPQGSTVIHPNDKVVIYK